jgi:transcriptional regulator with XRE-family HTH domain
MDGRALLAWNLRRLRSAQGLSQERLAADSGIDRAYVSELEREKGNATVDILDRLAAALGSSIADLFLEPEPGSKRPRPLQAGRKPA